MYTSNQWHPSLSTYFGALCVSGVYDPMTGCRNSLEVTTGGWPKSCTMDNECDGANYGTPGTCSCDNNNIYGNGYCLGFNGEANNMT